MQNIILPLTIIALFWACGASDADEMSSSPNTYTITIADSLEIPLMASFGAVLSVHPQNDDLLVYTSEGGQNILLHITQQGGIIKRFDYPKEGPASAGSLLMSAEFWKDGYAIMGYGYLVTYDQNFEPLKKIRIEQDLFGMVYGGVNHLQTIIQDGKEKLLIFYGQQESYNTIQPEFYENFHMLSVVDTETESFTPYGYLHQESIFKQGRAYYFMRPFFQATGTETRVVMNNDTVLYTFDAQGKEINRSVIPFDNYILFKGYTMGEAGIDEQSKPRDVGGTIQTYMHINGIDLIRYSSGVTLDRIQAIQGDSSKDLQLMQAEFREANPEKILLMKDGRRVSNDIKLPARVSVLSGVDSEGGIWAAQNVNALDTEPEYLTLYKLKIVEAKTDE
jgi:hypothetical protein